MADIPIAQPLPQLGTVQPLGVGAGLSTGLEAGTKMGYAAAQARAQELRNQYLPQTIALKQQEMQMLMQKQAAETAKAKADAINGIGQIAPLLKLLPISNAKQLLASHLAKLQSIYPGLPADSAQVTDDNIDEVEQWAKGRPEIEAKGSPDALTTYDSMWISKMGETQRDIVKDIKPVSPQEQFSQSETSKRTAFTQSQESQRASASATAPLVGSAYSVNLAKTALSKGDELNDHIAINEFGKLINNGTPVPLPELQKMAKSGTWGPKFAQAFSKFTGEGALSDEQRGMMQNALDTIGQSLQAQTQTRASQYPGATPPNLPSPSAYKVGQTVKFQQGTYKKIKPGPDTDPTTWGPNGTP